MYTATNKGVSALSQSDDHHLDEQHVAPDTDILKEKTEPPSVRMNIIFEMLHVWQPEYFQILDNILADREDHPDVRSAAALALAKLAKHREDLLDRSVVEMLITMVRDRDVTVRNYSVQALGMLGREEAIPALIDALKDEDNHVFHSAAESLGRIGKPAVPHLLALLDEGSDDARCIAAWKLGELRYVDAVPKLIQVIQEDSNTELLALCVWALGEIGFGPKEVLEILNWAKEQPVPEISKRANMAMKKIARHCN